MIEHTVGSLADLVGGQLVGDSDKTIRGVGDLRSAGPDQIGFVRDAKYREVAKETRAGALLVFEEFETEAAQILVDDVNAAFAKVALAFHPVPRAEQHEIHPTAVVHPDAALEEPVCVGPKAVIGRARVGAGSVVMSGVSVADGCGIGKNCVLYANVVLYERVQIGDNVIVHAGTVIGSDGFGYAKEEAKHLKLPQLGSVVIDDDVEIGANCTIDRGTLGPTRIGRGSKLDNLIHIAHNCTIGEDNALAGACALSGSTVLGDRVSLAGHVVSAGHLRVASDTRIGGNSVLYGDVTEPGDYLGHPLMEKTQFGRHFWALRRLVDFMRGKGTRKNAGEAKDREPGAPPTARQAEPATNASPTEAKKTHPKSAGKKPAKKGANKRAAGKGR